MQLQPATKPTEQRRAHVFRQPLHTLQIADALLKIQTVMCVTGLSESSIRRKVLVGKFPQPVKDGTRCTRWIAAHVTEWLRAKVKA
jgi:prophage regulatory protein